MKEKILLHCPFKVTMMQEQFCSAENFKVTVSWELWYYPYLENLYVLLAPGELEELGAVPGLLLLFLLQAAAGPPLYHPLLTHRACAELVFYLPDKLHGLGPRCLKTLSGYFSLNYCTMNYTALLLYTWFCNLIKKILNMKTYVLYLYFTAHKGPVNNLYVCIVGWIMEISY